MSDEVKVLAILEALRLFLRGCQDILLVESDSSNAITWVLNRKTLSLQVSQTVSWEFTITWKKILDLLRQIVNLEIHYCNRNVNNIVDLLVKLHSPSFTVFQTILSPEVQDNYMTEQRTAEINTRTTQW